MIIVVESGSTKADWMLVNGVSRVKVETMGFNPYFHDESVVENELRKVGALMNVRENVSRLFFYGAGCSNQELNKNIHKGLKNIFKNATISVDHDLNACAYSTYAGEPLIACILGTGSNSCYFDGQIVRQEVPSLGFILGDEGSGSYFGKRLLADYLYKKLPGDIGLELELMGLTTKGIIEEVYKKSNPNVYIASFMSVIVKYRDSKYCQAILRDGFRKFIEIHVKCYKQHKNVKVSFVGSIAYLLSVELKDVCREEGIEVGEIIRRPLENLVDYHLSNL